MFEFNYHRMAIRSSTVANNICKQNATGINDIVSDVFEDGCFDFEDTRSEERLNLGIHLFLILMLQAMILSVWQTAIFKVYIWIMLFI